MLVDLGRNDVGKVTDNAASLNNGQQSTSSWWSWKATRCCRLYIWFRSCQQRHDANGTRFKDVGR